MENTRITSTEFVEGRMYSIKAFGRIYDNSAIKALKVGKMLTFVRCRKQEDGTWKESTDFDGNLIKERAKIKGENFKYVLIFAGVVSDCANACDVVL